MNPSTSRPSKQREATFPVGWIELLLAASVAVLMFQLFPSAWSWLLGMIDIRGWTWWSYAVASVIWIVFFVGLKAWRDNR